MENDAVGRFTLTIKEVIQEDQGEWMAKINNEVFSKVQVYVEGQLPLLVFQKKLCCIITCVDHVECI